MKSVFENLIWTAFILLFVFIFLWWSLFCFQRGYNLGHRGTDNPMLNWAIAQFLLDKDEEGK